MDKKIDFYEKRIEEDKQLLDELKHESSEDNKNLYFRRINHLQAEINFMNEELSILRNKLNGNMMTMIPSNKMINPVQKIKEPIRKSNKDIESTVGKSLMGIFASLLIFVSLIFFSKLLYENLTDTIKTLLLFVVSFGITGIGLFLMNKNKENKVYLSITGSGIGALYISLFISNIFLETITGLLFYGLLLGWIFFVFILSKNQSILFQIIGQIGITLSVLLGNFKCLGAQEFDIFEYLIVIFFFVIASLSFYIFHLNKDNKGNLLNNTFNIINSFIIFLGITEIYNRSLLFDSLSVIIIFIAYLLITIIIQYFKTDILYNNISFGIYTILSIGLSLIIISYFEKYFLFSIFGAFISCCLLCINELKLNSKSRTIINSFCMVLIYYSLYDYAIISDILRYFIISTLLIFYGLSNNRKEFNNYGIAYFIISLSFSNDKSILFTIFALIELLGIFAYMFYKKNYSQYIKLGLFIPFLGFLISIYDYFHCNVNFVWTMFLLLIIGSLNICLWKTPLGKDWITNEKEEKTLKVCRNINASIMAICLGLFSVCDGVPLYLLIISSILFFMLNNQDILIQNTIKSNIYIGLKFTVLLICILSSLQAPSYLISISCLILAIVNIIYGFNKNYKALRVYGLILTLFNIVKLLLVDISFENTLGLPLSLFICGILCLLISYIYNKMEQNFNK